MNKNFLWICISTLYVLHDHKFQENSVEQFLKELCWRNVSQSIFHFDQISNFKKGVFPRKKIESKLPVDMHIYTLCLSLLQNFLKFSWAVSVDLRWRTVSYSIFHFGQISMFKMGVTLRNKIESKFPVSMRIYTKCPSLLQSFMKFCWVVSEELRWQERQDWRTDWLTKGRIENITPSATRCMGYKIFDEVQ